MAGLYYFPDSLPMDRRIPFRDVYFTGMVRDKQGRKMSKSLGNSPDLLELIDKYGADAVRFGIMIASPAGNDLLFDEAALEQGRNFNNKLWNALKLVKMWESRLQDTADIPTPFAVTWFDNRLKEARAEIDHLLAHFRLSEALKVLYSLIWDDFCSWYLEWAKPGFDELLDKGVYLQTVVFFEQLVQLLHPFMPFITEDLYHLLKERKDGDDLCVKQFEVYALAYKEIIAEGEFLKRVITDIRTLKAKAVFTSFNVYLTDSQYSKLFFLIQKSTKATKVKVAEGPISGYVRIVIGKDVIFIETEKPINRKEDLLKELEYQKGFLNTINKKLDNQKFVENAKPEVIALERKKKEDAEEKIKVLEESLAGIK